MNDLVSKVAKNCNISERQAHEEINAEVEVLMNDDNINYGNISEMAYNLGLDMEDIFSNPEALLSFM